MSVTRDIGIGKEAVYTDSRQSVGSATRLRTDIQALRGLAVLLVVFYHGKLLVAQNGYLGVDIFFVISGYVITTIVARDIRSGTFSFSAFYYRRAWRLLPAAYVVFAACIALAPFLLTSLEIRDFSQQLFGGVTFTANHVLWGQTGYFQQSADLKPLLHAWSLSLEEQYYLLLPAALMLAGTCYWVTAVVGATVLSFFLLLWNQADMPDATFYLFPTRAWELGIGSCIALISVRINNHRVRMVVGAFAAIVLLSVATVPIGEDSYSVLPKLAVCVATALLIVGNHEWLNETWLARRLAWVGMISYSLYLVHWPILAFLSNAHVGNGGLWWPVRVAAVVVSLLAAWALYRFIEQKLRYIGTRNVTGSKVLGLSLASATLLSLAAMVAWGEEVQDYSERFRPTVGLSRDCHEANNVVNSMKCRSTANPSLMVWGDSFAMHLVPGLATTNEGGVIQATAGTCAPIMGVALYAPPKYGGAWGEGCVAFNEKVFEGLVDSRSVQTVVLAGQWNYLLTASTLTFRDGDRLVQERMTMELLATQMGRMIGKLRERGKRVVLVEPPPSGGFNIARCVERMEAGKISFGAPPDCRVPLSTFRDGVSETRLFLKRVSTEHGVNVFSFEPHLCSSKSCDVTRGETILYRDAGHLSFEGSIAIAEQHRLTSRLERLAL